jgi:hypothetical protein
MYIIILILVELLIGISYYAYKQHKIAHDLIKFKPNPIIIGIPATFTTTDERILTSHKEALGLVTKKLDTRLSILFDSVRLPGEWIEFKQGKINMLLELRNDFQALYNRKDAE